MKISASMMQGKKFLGISTFLLMISLVFSSKAHAQSQSSVSSVPHLLNSNTSQFRAGAFPVLTPMQVRVVFENPALRQVCVTVCDSRGKIMYSKSYTNVPRYYSILDFSQLPAGEYLLELSCRPKIGKKKTSYRQTFQIHSRTEHSIIAWDKEQAKQLYTKKSFISGR